MTEERQVETAGSGTSTLVERVVRQMGLSASAQAVFGSPVTAHGHTVIPVARVYFLYGAGLGPELAGRSVERPPDGRLTPALSSGGGGGGMGIARPAGYIEIGPAGTRFVPATRDWKGILALAALVGLVLSLLRLGRG